MINKIPVENCVGCHACESACRHAAITMAIDDEGFLYPQIDDTKCRQCNSCLTVCPVLNEFRPERLPVPDVYAAWSLDEEIRAKSSSGGIFSELAKRTLESAGYVYGASFSRDFELSHQHIDSIKELHLLQGSKYIQSSLGTIFNRVREQLKLDNRILFTGTPCQIAGLNSFLGKDFSNLLTCDVICHGVASPGIFKKYIRELEKKYNTRIIDFQFRAKPYGWKDFYFNIVFSNGDHILEPFSQNLFMKGFLSDIYLRPSCYNCLYSRIPRVADITLGDFWGIWKYRPEWNDNKGLSALLINSCKGRQHITDAVFKLIEAELPWVIEGNPSLISSASPHKKRKKFFKLVKNNMNFETIISKCLPSTNYLGKIIWSIKRRIHGNER